MKRSWEIIIDTREQKPLMFPETLMVLDPARLPTKSAGTLVRVSTRSEALSRNHPEVKFADYYLDGYPTQVIIERKGSVSEVALNCLNPVRRKRFVEELKYLKARCKYPYLLLEGSYYKLLNSTKHIKHPGLAVDALTTLLMEYRIGQVVLPSNTPSARLATGEWAARLMIRGALTNVR